MGTETIKSLREKADELISGGINNKDALFEALPILTDLQTKAEFAKKSLASAVKSMTMLSELCSRYALKHESVFEKQKLVTSQQGVRIGDVIVDEVAYHFASGYDGYERNDGGKATQDFLAELPEAWRKSSFKLSTSGINAANPSDEDLAKYNLRPKAKNEWSRVEEV